MKPARHGIFALMELHKTIVLKKKQYKQVLLILSKNRRKKRKRKRFRLKPVTQKR